VKSVDPVKFPVTGRGFYAVIFRDIGDIRLDEFADAKIEHHGDAIVRLTASAICGTDSICVYVAP